MKTIMYDDSSIIGVNLQTSEKQTIASTGHLYVILDATGKVDFAKLTNPSKSDYIDNLRASLSNATEGETIQDLQEKLRRFEPNEKVKASIIIMVLIEIAADVDFDLACIEGQVFCFNGRYWEHMDESLFKTFLSEVAIKMGIDKYNAYKVDFKDLLYKQFMATANVNIGTERDENKVIINLKDQAFVCERDKTYFKKFEKKDYKKYCLDFKYNPDAKCPKFQEFLDTVLPNRDMQEIVREFVGYIFTDLKLEKALFFIGDGANGKSTLITIIAALLGPKHNVCYNSVGNLCDKSGYYRTELPNYLLNVCTEFSSRFDAQVLKQLISGEDITARTLFHDPITISNYCKLVFSANIFPKKDIEHSHGFNRRFLPIPFNETIPPERQNPYLANEIISEELSGIFNWVLVGLKRILRNKRFSITENVRSAIDDFQRQNDSVLLFIDEKGYVKSEKAHIDLKTIYKEYDEFCVESHLYAMSKQNFRKQLESALKFRVKDKCTNNATWVFCEIKEYIPKTDVENDNIIQSFIKS